MIKYYTNYGSHAQKTIRYNTQWWYIQPSFFWRRKNCKITRPISVFILFWYWYRSCRPDLGLVDPISVLLQDQYLFRSTLIRWEGGILDGNLNYSCTQQSIKRNTILSELIVFWSAVIFAFIKKEKKYSSSYAILLFYCTDKTNTIFIFPLLTFILPIRQFVVWEMFSNFFPYSYILFIYISATQFVVYLLFLLKLPISIELK